MRSSAAAEHSNVGRTLFDRGFVEIAEVCSRGEILEVTELLDGLFARGSRTKHLKGSRVSEIHRAVLYEKKLSRTAPFLRCQALASEWLGRKARYTFDHAIYKDSGEGSDICWHQDQAYQRLDLKMRSIHFWIPLQTMDEDSGGLEFVVGSHRSSLFAHRSVPDSSLLEIPAQKSWSRMRSGVSLGGLSAHLPHTIHRSTENRSGRTRKAWILHFGPYGKLDMLRPENLRLHLANLATRTRS